VADGFMDEMHAVRSNSETMQQALTELVHWIYEDVVGHDVLPRELPSEIAPVVYLLQRLAFETGESADAAVQRYSATPFHRAMAGRALSREEFHMVASQVETFWSNRTVGLGAFDDYEVFSLMCYEDNKRWAYINPQLSPPEPPAESGHSGRELGVQHRMGISPEEVAVCNLRSEQVEFFRRFLPDVYVRFRGGASQLDSNR
jgi:hypothetical protein